MPSTIDRDDWPPTRYVTLNGDAWSIEPAKINIKNSMNQYYSLYVEPLLVVRDTGITTPSTTAMIIIRIKQAIRK